jgi:glycosyltransferase involved in cell wall biosynthesis
VTGSLSYAVVTPVRNEVENLPVLAACLAAQEVPPEAWVIVDNGSTDATEALAQDLATTVPWIVTVAAPGVDGNVRGGPIVRAFTAGLEAIPKPVDVVVKLDADVSFEPDYFARLLAAFEADPSLGLSGGLCHELSDGVWRPLLGTRDHVTGASRAYRWDCLQAVLPLEERQGWDEIDAVKARSHGWSVRTIMDLELRHHRREGTRDGARKIVWEAQGETAYYMGYRFSYLVLRALFRARRDRHALAMVSAYASARARRAPRCPDPSVQDFMRREQSLRRLPLRIREALGKT